MNSTIRNIFAVLIGFIVGSLVNMGLIIVGPILVPPPDGVDMTTMESLAETIHLMGPLNFLVPFLAHALGTLVGVLTTSLIAASKRTILAYAMGAAFLMGGITAANMVPAPLWFIVADLLLAYLPMAWLGLTLANRIKPEVAPVAEVN